MEVRIGVVQSPREVVVDVDVDGAKLAADLDAALEADDDAIFWLTDAKGRRFGVPLKRIAYVEIDGEDAPKQVGFGRT